MIKCHNLECDSENSVNAKFCSKCSTVFTPLNRYKQLIISGGWNLFAFNKNRTQETFTLDAFRNISFQPVSVMQVRFINRFVVFLCVIFSAFAIFLSSIGRSITYDIDKYIINYIEYVVIGCGLIAAICIIFIFKWTYRKLLYKINADYIEDNFCGDGIVRIAQKSRMGLFDESNNKVLLSSKYSNIKHFNNEHLLLIKGNPKGLYSLTYKKIIIPALYDSILMFTNSVATVKLNAVEYHYDIKGNQLQ